MAPNPETGTGSGRMDPNSKSISELVSELRDSFQSSEFDRVEEALVAREARLKAELKEKEREIWSLKERIAFEKLERINAQLELKRLRQERCDEKKKSGGFGLSVDGGVIVKSDGEVGRGKVGVVGEKESGKVGEERNRVVGNNDSVAVKGNGEGLGASGGKLEIKNVICIEDSDEDECNSQATLVRKQTTSCTIIENDHQSSSEAFQKKLLTRAETIGNLKRKFASTCGMKFSGLDDLDSDTSSFSSSSSSSSGQFDIDKLPDATSLGLNFSRRNILLYEYRRVGKKDKVDGTV
ncbi:hypothetical protein Fmac_027167 [Flemingia macrophylla]|uniref:Uncharacterized protein n=1 Tax=Flemingia macrophylla TaxID=520843 RepID=A0ABD1LHF8_9FABA